MRILRQNTVLIATREGDERGSKWERERRAYLEEEEAEEEEESWDEADRGKRKQGEGRVNG